MKNKAVFTASVSPRRPSVTKSVLDRWTDRPTDRWTHAPIVTVATKKKEQERAHKEKICQGPFRAPKEAYIAPKLKSYTSHMGPLVTL